MKRPIILLFASLVSLGLLVACNPSPGARPPGDLPNGDPPDDPMTSDDLNLNLLGWTDRATGATAGTFTWTLAIYRSGVDGATEPLVLAFSDSASDLRVGGTGGAACSGLGDLDPDVSGLTITFKGTIGSGSCATLFAGFDPEDDDAATADGVAQGDKVAFEITLEEAPKTTSVDVDDAEDQVIRVVMSKVTVTDTNEDLDPVEYRISGRVTYKPSTITIAPANQ